MNENIKNLDPEPFELEILGGSYLPDVCEEAAEKANELNMQVKFEFNGIALTVNPGDDANLAEAVYHDISEARHQEYLKSPEHKKELRREHDAKNREGKKVTSLGGTMNQTLDSGLDAIIRWVAQLAKYSQRGLHPDDCKKILEAFEAADFEAGACCDLKKEFYATNKNIMGRYIVGQVMKCLQDNMPPHPITEKFAKDYFKIK